METFAHKYPYLELLLHICRKEGRLLEKRLRGIPFEKLDVLYVIGARRLGQFRHFVERGGRLVVIETDLAGIAALRAEEPLVTHPHVDIFYLTGSVETAAQKLAHKYPFRHIAAYGRYPKVKEALLRHTALAHTFLCEDLYRHHLLKNLLTNYRRIPGSFDVGALSLKGIPAIVCGAGPSLDPKQLERFENKAVIIGGGSAIAALGKRLHLALAFDPNEEEYHRLKEAAIDDVPLIYGARLFPRVFDIAHGPRGYMRTGTGGEIDLWLEEKLGLHPVMSHLDFSTEALSVTTMCIALAASMGCSPIILAGCDLALTDGKEYTSGVAVRKLHEGVAETLTQHKGVTTRTKWVLESRAIADYAKRHAEIEWINATPQGIGFTGITYQGLDTIDLPDRGDLRHLIRSQFVSIEADPEPSLRELKQSLLRCKTYLASNVTPGYVALLEDEIAYHLLLKPIRLAQKRIGKHEWRHLHGPLDQMIATW